MRDTSVTLSIERLHAQFGAKIHGLDLSQPLAANALAGVRDAFEAYSLLVFPQQALEPESQVRFSTLFGPLERAISRLADSGPGVHVSHLSNVDDNGHIIPAQDRQQLFHKANGFWHTDSSYKPQTALASLLFAIEVPASGGQTEFVSTRVAFEDLPQSRQLELDGLWAVHNFQRSRDMVAPNLVSKQVQQMLPPVERPLVRSNPSNGRKALYIASHAESINGKTVADSRILLDELMDWCTQSARVYTHEWAPGDLVMWDNRCTLHRGRPWRADVERRIMSRTTVIDAGYDDEVGSRVA